MAEGDLPCSAGRGYCECLKKDRSNEKRDEPQRFVSYFFESCGFALTEEWDQADGKDTRRAFIQTEGVRRYSESLKKSEAMKKETNRKDSSLTFLRAVVLLLLKNGNQADRKDTRRAFLQTEGTKVLRVSEKSPKQ